MTPSNSHSDTKEPKTDNFYSPANFSFYAQCPYQPFPAEAHHIRLLSITRNAGDRTFNFELTKGMRLSEIAGSYTALSYCAGDPKNTGEILIGGLAFNAFANLVQAIEETCGYLFDSRGSEEQSVLLWVDQICINQSDPDERAEQVSFMDEIYRSAVGVIVCLTTHDFARSASSCRSVRAMECIKQVYENVPELDRFLTSEHDSACGIGNNDWDLKEEISCRLSSYLIKAVRDEAFALDWLDVLRMRKMPWFSRVWVLQEYACNENVIFLFASQHVDGKTLAAVLLTYLWSGDLPSTVETDIAELHATEGLPTNSNQSGSSDASPAGRWLTLNSYDQKVYNTLRIKSYVSQQRRCIIDLLDHSRISIASDRRDHVYSCLGLASNTYGIKPYYKPDLSAEALFNHVMRLILINTQDINTIQSASTALGDHSETLPSWVPDWSESRTRSDAEYDNGHEEDLHAGGDTLAEIAFLDGGTTLQTKGVLLDTLVEEVKEQVWRGQRADRINTYSCPRGLKPRPYAHISSKPPQQGDEVWILYGSALPFLLRKVGNDYMFLRAVYVYSIHGTEVDNGCFMEYEVNLATETKTLRIR